MADFGIYGEMKGGILHNIPRHFVRYKYQNDTTGEYTATVMAASRQSGN